jgi:hypothetical protein
MSVKHCQRITPMFYLNEAMLDNLESVFQFKMDREFSTGFQAELMITEFLGLRCESVQMRHNFSQNFGVLLRVPILRIGQLSHTYLNLIRTAGRGFLETRAKRPPLIRLSGQRV